MQRLVVALLSLSRPLIIAIILIVALIVIIVIILVIVRMVIIVVMGNNSSNSNAGHGLRVASSIFSRACVGGRAWRVLRYPVAGDVVLGSVWRHIM